MISSDEHCTKILSKNLRQSVLSVLSVPHYYGSLDLFRFIGITLMRLINADL